MQIQSPTGMTGPAAPLNPVLQKAIQDWRQALLTTSGAPRAGSGYGQLVTSSPLGTTVAPTYQYATTSPLPPLSEQALQRLNPQGNPKLTAILQQINTTSPDCQRLLATLAEHNIPFQLQPNLKTPQGVAVGGYYNPQTKQIMLNDKPLTGTPEQQAQQLEVLIGDTVHEGLHALIDIQRQKVAGGVIPPYETDARAEEAVVENVSNLILNKDQSTALAEANKLVHNPIYQGMAKGDVAPFLQALTQAGITGFNPQEQAALQQTVNQA